MKKILAISTIVSGLLASTIVPYSAYLNYDNSKKSNAFLLGAYLSTKDFVYKYEMDLEYLNLSYKNGDKYYQTDATFMFNYFVGYNYKFKAGLHNIFSNMSSNGVNNYDYSYVLIGEAMYYEGLKYNTSVDAYYSHYDDVNAIQVTPKIGFSFGNFYSPIGSFYLEGDMNLIKLSNTDTSPKSSYVNYDLKLQNFNGAYITTLKTSFGKSAYKVTSGGFVVYNLGEEYKNSYSFGISKVLLDRSSVGIEIGHSSFNENGNDAFSNSIMLKYTSAF